jgi:azurin
MLHNLVIVRPGGLARVADAALKLGLDGMKLSFVPPTGEVLYHTALIEPGKSEAIFFEAPATPGDYPFVCSFPGHAGTMQGVMRVRR